MQPTRSAACSPERLSQYEPYERYAALCFCELSHLCVGGTQLFALEELKWVNKGRQLPETGRRGTIFRLITGWLPLAVLDRVRSPCLVLCEWAKNRYFSNLVRLWRRAVVVKSVHRGDRSEVKYVVCVVGEHKTEFQQRVGCP